MSDQRNHNGEYCLIIERRIDEVRELNNQENKLINDRLTWMLLINGLLANAFVEVIHQYLKTEEDASYLFLMAALSILGFVISRSFYNSLALAHSVLKKLVRRYKKLIEAMDYPNCTKWPIAIGLFCNIEDIEELDKPVGKKQFWDPWKTTPMAFIILWITLLVLTGFYAIIR